MRIRILFSAGDVAGFVDLLIASLGERSFERVALSESPRTKLKWEFSADRLLRTLAEHGCAQVGGRGRSLWLEADRAGFGYASLFCKPTALGVSDSCALWAKCRPPVQHACACLHEECSHRNLARIRVASLREPGTSPVGMDLSRYLPGLYWNNYIDNAILRHFGQSVDHLRAVRPYSIIPGPHGVCVQMYEAPSQWELHAAEVDGFLENAVGFFSIRRIGLPGEIDIPASIELGKRLGREWP